MNYELAKKLRDAGFPNDYVYDLETGGDIEWGGMLSQLIEACGDRGMFQLTKRHDKDNQPFWQAETPHLKLRLLIKEEGQSPEEAVAKLWLKLHEAK